MKTPVCDFVENYIKSDALRVHMPGHKGKDLLGFEKYDITEFFGADSLYDANGIIKESEDNASKIFGANTFYSTEGSSQCIRALVYLVCKFAKQNGNKPHIFATRNVHKTFLSALAVLDFDITWIYGDNKTSYLSCNINIHDIEYAFKNAKTLPCALYITSPDYLGNMQDIKKIADVCHKYNVLLLVDNAHGAYLKFSGNHPVDLGADIVCDSAHKTLPCLTGGAYLHISHNAPSFFKENAKEALGMFGSTSPSYLILQSLDKINPYLYYDFKNELTYFIKDLDKLKNELILNGYNFYGVEPLKLTFDIKKYGYSGIDFANILIKNNIYPEFYDNDFVVLMLNTQNTKSELKRLKDVLLGIEKKSELKTIPPKLTNPNHKMSVKDALFAKREILNVKNCEGKIFASLSASCPPAVPIVVCGEEIDKNIIDLFLYYGITKCEVVKE